MRHLRFALGCALITCACAPSGGVSFDGLKPREEVPPKTFRVSGSVEIAGAPDRPKKGIELTLRASGAGDRKTATTTSEGAFEFTGLEAANYLLTVVGPTYAMEPLLVDVAADIDLKTIIVNVNLSGGGKLLGRVRVKGDAGPVAGARVAVSAGGAVVSATDVAEDGSFAIAVAADTYRLVASHPSYVSASVADVVVKQGETKDLTATPLVLDVNPATVTGTVLLERDGDTAKAAEGARVALDDSAVAATVDAQGRFQLDGILAGLHTLRFSATTSYANENRAITLVPGKANAAVDVTLKLARGRVKGSVQLKDGRPAIGVTVAISGDPNHTATAVPDAIDAAKANFVLDNLPLGTFTVEARKERYGVSSAAVTVLRDQTVDVGTLALSLLQGDFTIDDDDVTSAAGFTTTSAMDADT